MTFFLNSHVGLSKSKPNFQEQLQNFEFAASKFNIDRDSTSKGLSENLKKNVMG